MANRVLETGEQVSAIGLTWKIIFLALGTQA
jgi:hypothetical protein